MSRQHPTEKEDEMSQKKKSSVETITPMKDNDGVWRVAGYTIQ
jgi:hypothetical protein